MDERFTKVKHEDYVEYRAAGNVSIHDVFCFVRAGTEALQQTPLLWDLRNAQFDFRESDYKEIRSAITGLGIEWGIRTGSRTAITVSGEGHLGLARIVATLLMQNTNGLTIEVFQYISEAKKWLLPEKA